MRISILIGTLLVVLFVACGEKKAPEQLPPATPTPAADSAPMVRPSPVPAEPPPSFEEMVVHDYAKLAASAPKHVTDSIVARYKGNPQAFGKAMEKYFHDRDTSVRRMIAETYGITTDSLNTILKKQNSRRK